MSNLHGLLVVDKPGLAGSAQPAPSSAPPAGQLPTSHDIVQQVRRWSGERRIGHTGTLDPMASGVLVLCLGLATRLVEYYQGHDKQYYAEVTLGVATDTYDALGKTMTVAPVPALNRAKAEAALHHFGGSVLQSPPVYSAIKQGGESAHRKARRGESVTLAPRAVTFYQLDLLALDAPDRLSLRIRCSAGAYVRSLAHDLGKALGTVAHLSALRREAAGPFTLDQAHDLTEIESAARQGAMAPLMLPPGAGLALPRLTITPEMARRLGHGQWIPHPEGGTQATQRADGADPGAEDGIAQAYHTDGSFAGIVRVMQTQPGGEFVIKAEKWFAQALN
ncbi:MAG: tRNA pseudouridine(55) synthase TruB [Caldilineaceae bacterium]|nr:tRNA pseudouridine(55) synthase TruB [Caldilineaceae bacterium]